jgi:hypothetical protein
LPAVRSLERCAGTLRDAWRACGGRAPTREDGVHTVSLCGLFVAASTCFRALQLAQCTRISPQHAPWYSHARAQAVTRSAGSTAQCFSLRAALCHATQTTLRRRSDSHSVARTQHTRTRSMRATDHLTKRGGPQPSIHFFVWYAATTQVREGLEGACQGAAPPIALPTCPRLSSVDIMAT